MQDSNRADSKSPPTPPASVNGETGVVRSGGGCGECFYKRTKFVSTRGPRNAKIVFLAESPGPIELAKGKAFIGPGADLLFKNLPEGIDLDSILFLYAHECYPARTKDTKKNTANTQQAVKRCYGRLKYILNEYPREIILALGNGALWAATGDDTLKITQERGKLYTTPLASKGVVPTYHPVYLLRGGGSLSKFRMDIEYMFSLAEGGGKKVPIVPEWEEIQSIDDIPRIRQELLNSTSEWGQECGADVETTGFDHIDNELINIGLCVDPHKVFIVPKLLLPHVGPILEDENLKFIWHNGKFDVKFMRQLGIQARVDEDTMLMNYALDETRGMHDLEQISADLLGAPDYKEMVKPYITGKRDDGTPRNYSDIPTPILNKYLAFDASNTKQIYMKLRDKLNADKVSSKLYRKVLLPASDLLVKVEENGIGVNLKQREENVEYYTELLVSMEREMNTISQDLIGKDINPRSPKQLKVFLYDVLKLGNKGMSTDKETLDRLPSHPYVDILKKHRKAQKAYGTYVKKLHLQRSSDGRIHTTFLLHGTATGRLASRDPNLQNQLRLARIRNQFAADEGKVLMEFDLDQAELRCLAALSGDKAFCAVYETPNTSLHKVVSKTLWSEDWAERYAIDTPGDPRYDQAKEEYMRTKALNFGIVYGREAPSIAEEFEVLTSEAQRWIDGWAERFPDAWNFIERCRMAPLRGQNLVTPFGRRKRVGVVSRDKIRDLQNEAANFPHQSIASDITLLSAVMLQQWIEVNNLNEVIKIVNLVHDAIIVEVANKPEIMEPLKYVATRIMQYTPIKWGIDRIPFVADAKVGHLWGELHDTPVNRELCIEDYGFKIDPLIVN